MSNAVPNNQMLSAAIFVTLSLVGQSRAEQTLLLVGQSSQRASLVSADGEGELTFEIDGELREVQTSDLVRWSTVPTNTKRGELILIDGSRITLAEAWAGEPFRLLDGGLVLANTHLFGQVELKRSDIRAIVLRAPRDVTRRSRFIDRLRSTGVEKDVILTSNGDEWAGEVLPATKGGGEQRSIKIRLAVSNQTIDVGEKQITAICLQSQTNLPAGRGELTIGLRDGSQLQATQLKATPLRANKSECRIQLACGIQLNSSDVRDVAYLRSLGQQCIYLSALPELDYQHVPYLELPWTFRRDRNVLGGPLRASDHIYDRGLGMHTASRLTCDLENPIALKRFRRFVTSVAVDDAAGQRGSVIFRVYLQRGGQWQEAFASPIVRGGNAPLPIEVQLGDAAKLALVTDFADRGDELDYANWLEARLE